MSAAPLVSLLIPAYRPRFFGEALASAAAQRHPNLEIVVGDDSPGGEIEAIVKASGDPRIRYERHGPALGFAGNFTRLFEISSGPFVKFLNDDDVLHPDCVPRLLSPMLARPDIALATSRRVVIGSDGRALPGDTATHPLMPADGFMEGKALGRFLLRLSVNRIGEPSTVLLRRDAVSLEGDSIFRWGANDYECLADLSLWLRLLAKGGAWWVAEPLSAYRYHEGQQQRTAGTSARCIIERWLIVEDGARAGFLEAAEDYDEAARVAVGVFRRFLGDAAQAPELLAALRDFAPRIPARYLAAPGGSGA